LWPQRGGGISGVPHGVILVAPGTELLTLSAKVNLQRSCRRSGVCSIVAARTAGRATNAIDTVGPMALG
jgi:hypothetical protein